MKHITSKFFVGTQQSKFLKKFYKKATVEKLENPPNPTHKFTIKLDNRTVRTPQRHIIATPTYELAYLIAHEFNC